MTYELDLGMVLLRRDHVLKLVLALSSMSFETAGLCTPMCTPPAAVLELEVY